MPQESPPLTRTVSVNAPKDIGTLLVDSLLIEHGITPNQVHFNNAVPFPVVGQALQSNSISAAFSPEPFVSRDEETSGIQELADLDQGFTQGFPIQGYAVTQAWAQKYPNTPKAFTTALSQGQEIADTNRAAVEKAVEKYLAIKARGRGVHLASHLPAWSRCRTAAAGGERHAEV